MHFNCESKSNNIEKLILMCRVLKYENINSKDATEIALESFVEILLRHIDSESIGEQLACVSVIKLCLPIIDNPSNQPSSLLMQRLCLLCLKMFQVKSYILYNKKHRTFWMFEVSICSFYFFIFIFFLFFVFV